MSEKREKREKPHWEGKHYSFFQNTECEYFPCHRIADPARFSCLFCYCPLYMLGPRCGGNFRYTEKGIKDCTNCVIPHLPENYGRITGKYKEIAAAMGQIQSNLSENESREEALSISDSPEGRAKFSESDSPKEKSKFLESDSPKERTKFSESDSPNERAKLAESDSPKEKAKLPESASGAAFEKCGDSQEAESRPHYAKIVMMACTERGFETMRRAAAALADLFPESEIIQTGHCAGVPGYENGPRLSAVTKKWFHGADALIFFSATGIAVRCIAPYARDKFRDPAVLVSDENGRFVISLMSGHAGGANRLSLALADVLGAQPVITTATDGRGLFAVDVFAVENGLKISDRIIAKQISARILSGEVPKIFFEDTFTGDACGLSVKNDISEKNGEQIRKIAERLKIYGEGVLETKERREADIIVSCRKRPEDRGNALYLIPGAVILGIGCRKGIAEEAVRRAVQETLQTSGIFRQSITGIASIDLKKNERGLLAFAEDWNLPVTFYTAAELNAVPGDFSASGFVRNVTGVDCVCERSAARLSLEKSVLSDCIAAKEKGISLKKPVSDPAGKKEPPCRVPLLVKKQSLDGVTAALALHIFLI